MIARLICGFCALALTAGTASAGGTSSKALPKGDPDRVVCRVSNDTGSRLGKVRVCKTNAEWAEMRRQARETVDQIQSSRSMNSN